MPRSRPFPVAIRKGLGGAAAGSADLGRERERLEPDAEADRGGVRPEPPEETVVASAAAQGPAAPFRVESEGEARVVGGLRRPGQVDDDLESRPDLARRPRHGGERPRGVRENGEVEERRRRVEAREESGGDLFRLRPVRPARTETLRETADAPGPGIGERLLEGAPLPVHEPRRDRREDRRQEPRPPERQAEPPGRHLGRRVEKRTEHPEVRLERAVAVELRPDLGELARPPEARRLVADDVAPVEERHRHRQAGEARGDDARGHRREVGAKREELAPAVHEAVEPLVAFRRDAVVRRGEVEDREDRLAESGVREGPDDGLLDPPAALRGLEEERLDAAREVRGGRAHGFTSKRERMRAGRRATSVAASAGRPVKRAD